MSSDRPWQIDVIQPDDVPTQLLVWPGLPGGFETHRVVLTEAVRARQVYAAARRRLKPNLRQQLASAEGQCWVDRSVVDGLPTVKHPVVPG